MYELEPILGGKLNKDVHQEQSLDNEALDVLHKHLSDLNKANSKFEDVLEELIEETEQEK